MCSATGDFTTIFSTVSPSSWIKALWPAIRLPGAGTESALVMPSARVTRKSSLRGLSASRTRSSGWTGSVYSVASTVICSAGISTKPNWSPASIIPGMTTLPRASITRAPAGACTSRPTAAILPFSTTTVPLSMTPRVNVSSLPPVMAITFWARAVRLTALEMRAVRMVSLRIMANLRRTRHLSLVTCRLSLVTVLRRQRRGTVFPRQKAVLQCKDQLPVDEHLVGLRAQLERVAGPDGQVGVLADLDRAHAVVDGQDFRRVDGHGLERGLVGHPVVVDDRRLLDVIALLDHRVVGVQADGDAVLPQHVGVLRDRVPHFDLGAPQVRKGDHADVAPGNLGRNHVGVERVVQRRDLEVKLVRDAEERLEVIHLVGVDVQPHLAGEH